MASPADQEVLYDVLLLRRVPDTLRQEFPDMQVCTSGVRTVLQVRVDGPDELLGQLSKVRSVGCALTRLHRCADRAPSEGAASTYEVWVKDELGSPLLWYLHCAHRVVREPTQVRLALGATRLQHFVRACARYGATIDWLQRVDPVPQP